MQSKDSAYLEVKFPEFGHVVLYSDNMYEGLRREQLYPSHLLTKYQT